MTSRCSVGMVLNSECNLSSYTEKVEMYFYEGLTEEEKYLFLARTTIPEKDMHSVCLHHKLRYLDYFSSFEVKCCDPFKTHKKNINAGKRA